MRWGLIDAGYGPGPWSHGGKEQLLGLNELAVRWVDNCVCQQLLVPLKALAVRGAQTVVAVQPTIASDAPRVQQP